MRIAVTTPTGNVGSRVVRLLLQAGVRPTLLLRDPTRLEPWIRERVDICQGDQRDPDFVRKSTQGVDSLFWVDPTDFAAEDPNEVSAVIGANVAEAVTANGIARTVFQSSAGAEKRHGAGLIDGLARIEEQLDATGSNVLYLRCGYFFTNLLMDVDSLRAGVITTNRPGVTMPWVDPRDIGDIVAARLLSTEWSGRQVAGVQGPADLTWAEVTSILEQATGKPFRLVPVSDDDVRSGLLSAGMSETAANGVVAMTTWMEDGFKPEVPRSPLSTTPTTLAAWAHDYVRPLLG